MQEDLRAWLERVRNDVEIHFFASVEKDKLAKLQYNYRRKEAVLLIDKIAASNCSFVTNLMANRQALARLLSCDLADIHASMLKRIALLIPPKQVSKGPCQEIQLVGEDVDLTKLPALQFSKEDAGPYITGGIVFARHRGEEAYQNASIHRMQIQGKRQLGIRLEKGHLLKIQKEAEYKGEDLEVAIAIGNHPAELLASVSGLDFGVNELDLAGAIRQEPVEVVKGITVDIELPAVSEIIIEGIIPADKRAKEGPFGDFQGYYVPAEENHLIEVKALTHRSDSPLFTSISAGSHEDAILLGFKNEVRIYQALKAHHQVMAVNLSPMVFNGVIAVKKRSDDEGKKILQTAFDHYPWLKYCLLVDEDVDCYNLEDVYWALATRSNPSTSLHQIEAEGAFARDPFHRHSGKLGIDATVPLSHRRFFRRTAP